jgi:hypothetical protein
MKKTKTKKSRATVPLKIWDLEKLTMKCSNGANINQKMRKVVMYLEAKN